MMRAPPASREVGVPTIYRLGPYRFYFWSREHEPPHVHVNSPEGAVVFNLNPVRILRANGYTPRKIKEIEAQVIIHREAFLDRWHEYFDE